MSGGVQVVRLADVAAQPWKNGGGLTRELLAWPNAADWRVRVSVARIDRDGPFSPFPGVGRAFAVLDGAGVELRFGTPVTRMTPADPPLHFDGAAAPGCTLIDGPTEDLNLMVRGSPASKGAMARVDRGEIGTGPAGCFWRGVFVLDGCALHAGAARHALEAGTLAWTVADDPTFAADWRLAGPADARAFALHAERS